MSIRARLAVLYCAALALTVTAFAFLVWSQYSAGLRDSLDEALRVHAEDVQTALREPDVTRIQAVDPARPGIFTGLFNASGKLLTAGPGFPRGFVEAPAGLSTRQIPEGGAEYRLDTVELSDGRRLVIGSSLADLERGEEHLAVVLGGIGAAAWFASLIGSWLLAGRALGPLRRLSDRVAALPPRELSLRLPVGNRHDEIATLASSLNGMLARVEAAADRERTFLAGAAHDLRTPIAALRTELELAIAGGTPEAALTAVGAAHADAVRLSELADGLLNLAEAEADQEADPPRLTNVREVVDRVFRDVRWEADSRDVRLEAQGGAAVVALPPIRVEQALTNLVRNAIRHGPAHGTVQVVTGIARDGAGDKPRHLHLEVRDRGPGLDLSTGDHAGGARSGRTPDGHAGLGLATVAAAMRSMDGDAGYRDRPGGGSVFWLDVPLAEGSQAR